MTAHAWIDGDILPLADATVALADPGYLLGDGLFESLYVSAGRAFRWDLHRQRLLLGMALVGIDERAISLADVAVSALAATCVDTPDRALRVQVTRQPSGDGKVTALLKPLPFYAPTLYHRGARVMLATWRRDHRDPFYGVKSLSFQRSVLLRRYAVAQGYDDAMVLNTHDDVAEASYANVLARRGDTVYAPDSSQGALDGVTRDVLLATLANAYRVETRLPQALLPTMDEVMLTSTYAGVVPVHSISSAQQQYSYAIETRTLTQLLRQRYCQMLEQLRQ